jgi:hypothetical protein
MRSWRVPTRWQPIPSCPGYEASDYGRIWSIQSKRMLVGGVDRYGYHNVNLTIGGKMVRRKVHRLVCEAWHGPAPSPQHHAAHLDGSRDNNRQENLVWATQGENERHKLIHGTSNLIFDGMPGASNPNSKLTNEQAAAIKAAPGSMRQLGREYGVSAATICRVKNGQRYHEVATPKTHQGNSQ